MAQFTLWALIIQVISSNPNAYRLACSEPMLFDCLLCGDNFEKGIWHLYQYNSRILHEVPFLVEESTIQAIKQELGLRDHEWQYGFGRESLENIAMRVRAEKAGRPIIRI